LIFHVHHNTGILIVKSSSKTLQKYKKTLPENLMYPANPNGIPTVAACLKMLSERCNTLVLQLGGRKRNTAFLNGW